MGMPAAPESQRVQRARAYHIDRVAQEWRIPAPSWENPTVRAHISAHIGLREFHTKLNTIADRITSDEKHILHTPEIFTPENVLRARQAELLLRGALDILEPAPNPRESEHIAHPNYLREKIGAAISGFGLKLVELTPEEVAARKQDQKQEEAQDVWHEPESQLPSSRRGRMLDLSFERAQESEKRAYIPVTPPVSSQETYETSWYPQVREYGDLITIGKSLYAELLTPELVPAPGLRFSSWDRRVSASHLVWASLLVLGSGQYPLDPEELARHINEALARFGLKAASKESEQAAGNQGAADQKQGGA